MPKPSRREVESCHQYLERLVRQAEDHEYRNDPLDESELKLLERRLRTALQVIHGDSEPELHNWIIDILQWMHEGKELNFRTVGRKAGPIADEILQVLRHEYGGESAARKHTPRRGVTLPVKQQPPPPSEAR